jgi:hypothetical protein
MLMPIILSYTVYLIYSFYYSMVYKLETNIYYVHPCLHYMVRKMKAIITQIESAVTPSGNSGHVVVPKQKEEARITRSI